MDWDLLTGELTERESLNITKQTLLFSPKSFSASVRSIPGKPVTILSHAAQAGYNGTKAKYQIGCACPIL